MALYQLPPLTRKVLDVEIMSKFCFVCHTNRTSQHECKNNYAGTSGGMDGAGGLNIFNRSLDTRGQQSIPKGICREALWSQHICNKIRMYSSCTEKNGSKAEETCERKDRNKFHDSKPLGGKGCLTHSEIDKFQNYCGLAIRTNVNNLEAMMRAFFTSCQQMRNPSIVFAQAVMTVGVNSRTLPVQGLHMNINILYQLLLWMQLNQCSGILLL